MDEQRGGGHGPSTFRSFLLIQQITDPHLLQASSSSHHDYVSHNIKRSGTYTQSLRVQSTLINWIKQALLGIENLLENHSTGKHFWYILNFLSYIFYEQLRKPCLWVV